MVYRVVVVLLGLCLSLVSQTVHAAIPNNGLFVSPSRQEVKVAAGESSSGTVTVNNFYSKSLQVSIFVKEFSAADETYNYTFSDPIDKWVSVAPEYEKIYLDKGAGKTIPFTVALPKNATPGDRYFAVFASADMSGTGFRQTAQVASLIYIQVVGGKIIRSATIENADIPSIVLGPTMTYAFKAKNNGNVHFDAYFYARLEGLFGKYPMSGNDQVVLRNTTRQLSGKLTMPTLPGLYKVSYGYVSDDSSPSTTRFAYIIYIPPWSLVAVALMILVVVWTIQRRKRTD